MEIGSEETINYNIKPTLIKVIIKKDRYLWSHALRRLLLSLYSIGTGGGTTNSTNYIVYVHTKRNSHQCLIINGRSDI